MRSTASNAHSDWVRQLLDALEQSAGRPSVAIPLETQVDAVHLAWIGTPLGPMVAGAGSQGVCLLEFAEREILAKEFEFLRRRIGPLLPGNAPYLRQLRCELTEYFEGQRKEFTVPTTCFGTPFELSVWRELGRIPYGEVRSYEDIACRVGREHAMRAVGRANGLNRVAIVIPCHRVIHKSGSLAGYGGGVWRKRLLLELERGGQQLRLLGGFTTRAMRKSAGGARL